MRFDDSRISHVEHAIPLLNEHGLKATFMINPGKREYQKYQNFWENEVPLMGHRLGNHTMHHNGARSLAIAEYEIGEVSRLIWRLYPDETPLNVFASGGGGVKWGGELWEDAKDDYKQIVRNYTLIDLYDGNHRSKPYNSGDTPEEYCRMIEDAIESGRHRAFHFHTVGKPDLKDRIHKLLKGVSLDVDLKTFSSILECINEKRDRIWVAPLVDILKYQTQYNGSKLTIRSESMQELELSLIVTADIALYDHDLTVLLPDQKDRKLQAIYQDGKSIRLPSSKQGGVWVFDVEPVSSTILIRYN